MFGDTVLHISGYKLKGEVGRLLGTINEKKEKEDGS